MSKFKHINKLARNGLKVVAMVMAAAITVSSANYAAPAAAVPSAATYEGKGGSYYSYVRDFQGAAHPQGEIILAAADADTSAELTDAYGKPAIVLDKDAPSAEWSFDAAESGVYNIAIEYYQLPASGRDIEMSLKLNGELPFDEASLLSLKRLWRDESAVRVINGNDFPPNVIEEPAWQTVALDEKEGFFSGTYEFYVEKGANTLSIELSREAMAVSEIKFYQKPKHVTYSEYAQKYSGGANNAPADYAQIIEAEHTALKSDQALRPMYDRTSAATSPNDPAKIKLNTIGQWTWAKQGMWVSWDFDVPEDGFYEISLKARQNWQLGMSTVRRVYIDGEVPFAEMNAVSFPYSGSWYTQTLGDSDKSPYKFYLTKGTHSLKLEATVGNWAEVIAVVDQSAYALNDLYRKIIMITSPNPDPYRDYYLERELPFLLNELESNAKILDEAVIMFEELNGKASSTSALLKRVSEQLKDFIKEPQTIPARIKKMRENVNALSAWILTVLDQPLELDYIHVAAEGVKPPKANAGFFQSIAFSVQSFFSSFFEDYNSIGESGDEEAQDITVWFFGGRDQAQILKYMIDDSFSTNSGVNVKMSLVQSGLVEAILAGKGPDVTLMVSRGQPVNLAVRGALQDLTVFEGFDEVMERFTPGAATPYTFDGGVYALPVTQGYHMMFYRTDVFDDLNIQPPNTWTELYDVMQTLNRNNMSVGLPYQKTDAQELINSGLGARNIFSTLLLQGGGQFYTDDLTETALGTPEAVQAFKQWVDFYTMYKLELYYDFFNRFRSGEMPIAIAPFSQYNQLSVSAPEIRGLWDMVPIPGTMRPDGTIDRSEATGDGDAGAIMLSNAKNKEACWQFMDWFTTEATQTSYGQQLEGIMGPGARFNTANDAAFNNLAWTNRELELLNEQKSHLKDIPEVPGGYYLIRTLDNAFRSVLYQNENYREALFVCNKSTNEELARKRNELFGN